MAAKESGCDSALEVELMESISDCRFEELSLARQIEAKTRELEELQRLTKLKDSCAQENAILEALNGVSVLSVSKDELCLEIRTHITNMALEDYKSDAKADPEFVVHKLQITLDASKLLIQDAELVPKSVDIREVVLALQREGMPGNFLDHLPFFVKQVQSCIRSSAKNKKKSARTRKR